MHLYKSCLLLIFCTVLCVFTACSSSSGSSSSSGRQVPGSSGKIDELLIVMDQAEWDDTLGAVVRGMFQEEYPGLPQTEPRFDISQVDPLSFINLLQRASNIVYVGVTEPSSNAGRAIQKGLDAMPEGKSPKYMFSLKDLWAKPQQVTYVYANSEAELLQVLRDKKKVIVDRVYEAENAKALRNMYASRVNPDLTEKLKRDFKIDLPIPKSFRFVKQTENVFWVRQDVEREVSNIMVHVQPYENESEFTAGHPIFAREEVGKFFFTDTPGSSMVTDLDAGPAQEKLKLDGKQAIESRGLWKMSNDYMGGPYINYSILDTKNKRIITIDGNVYAPQWKKRRSMRKLETMLKQIKLL